MKTSVRQMTLCKSSWACQRSWCKGDEVAGRSWDCSSGGARSVSRGGSSGDGDHMQPRDECEEAQEDGEPKSEAEWDGVSAKMRWWTGWQK